MKPFLLGILKCKNCPFTAKLSLNATEVKELDVEDWKVLDLAILKKDEGAVIKRIIENFGITEISEEDVQEFCHSKNDKINKLLFGVDVVAGSLTCEECKSVYPIYDSIVDTVDTK